MFQRRSRRQTATTNSLKPEQAWDTRINFAWNIHTAQEEWTAKVDAKATFVLSLLTIALAAVLALAASADEKLLPDNPLWPADYSFRQTFTALGVLATVVGIFFAAKAVFPQLKSEPNDSGIIYFGHLRKRPHSEVLRQLRSLGQADALDSLSQQIVAMSQVNWRKHKDLQRALLIGGIGWLVLVLLLLLPATGGVVNQPPAIPVPTPTHT